MPKLLYMDELGSHNILICSQSQINSTCDPYIFNIGRGEFVYLCVEEPLQHNRVMYILIIVTATKYLRLLCAHMHAVVVQKFMIIYVGGQLWCQLFFLPNTYMCYPVRVYIGQLKMYYILQKSMRHCNYESITHQILRMLKM